MGNCLDRSLSSSSSSIDDLDLHSHSLNSSSHNHHQDSSNNSSLRRRYHLNSQRSSNRYIHLNESTVSIDGSSNNRPTNLNSNNSISFASNLSNTYTNSNNHNNNSNNNNNSSLNNFFSPHNNNNNGSIASSNPSQQVFYISPNQHRTAEQLTEEEQIRLLKRMTLIQQLPTGSYDQNKKNKE